VLISNAFLALAGSFSVMYVSVVVPNSYDFNRSIYVIIYVLLGGFAYPLAGPIVGALVLTGLAEILRPFQEYEPIITGVLTILIIMFAPNGLLGVLDNHIKPLFLKLVRPLRGASGPPDGPSAQGGGS
jgi:branched-chain amino acid transport system permease protein